MSQGVGVSLNDLVYLYEPWGHGKVMTMDIRQFANRGIPIYEELQGFLACHETD